jgi:hypothetical protein
MTKTFNYDQITIEKRATPGKVEIGSFDKMLFLLGKSHENGFIPLHFQTLYEKACLLLNSAWICWGAVIQCCVLEILASTMVLEIAHTYLVSFVASGVMMVGDLISGESLDLYLHI